MYVTDDFELYKRYSVILLCFLQSILYFWKLKNQINIIKKKTLLFWFQLSYLSRFQIFKKFCFCWFSTLEMSAGFAVSFCWCDLQRSVFSKIIHALLNKVVYKESCTLIFGLWKKFLLCIQITRLQPQQAKKLNTI